MEQDYLEFLHITKNFPGVTALDDVSMSVHRGEIHALVGENGPTEGSSGWMVIR